jgi:hypothetical protein
MTDEEKEELIRRFKNELRMLLIALLILVAAIFTGGFQFIP